MKRFKDLKVGEVFFFIGEQIYPGIARGPWKKTSTRKYVHTSTFMECRVGSINVEVFGGESKVIKEGE